MQPRKYYRQRLAERALSILFLRKLLKPIALAFHRLAMLLLRGAGATAEAGQVFAHTETDLRRMLKESHKSGIIDGNEMKLVDNILEFGDTTAREIMIPRTEMICLNAAWTIEQNKSLAIASMRTRYPVCEGDKDNIIGFVHIKDLLMEGGAREKSLPELLRPIIAVPESMPISDLLQLLQINKAQIAILIDEYGGTSGLVTMEDIMEEIVGEIQDEFDADSSPIIKRQDGIFSITGMMLIEEVNGYFDAGIESDDYDTIGGWMYSHLNFPPQVNSVITYTSGTGIRFEFRIEELHHWRIARIAVNVGSAFELRKEAE